MYLATVIINTQMQNNKFKVQAVPSSSFKCSCHETEATCWSLSSKLPAGQINSIKPMPAQENHSSVACISA